MNVSQLDKSIEGVKHQRRWFSKLSGAQRSSCLLIWCQTILLKINHVMIFFAVNAIVNVLVQDATNRRIDVWQDRPAEGMGGLCVTTAIGAIAGAGISVSGFDKVVSDRDDVHSKSRLWNKLGCIVLLPCHVVATLCQSS